MANEKLEEKEEEREEKEEEKEEEREDKEEKEENPIGKKLDEVESAVVECMGAIADHIADTNTRLEEIDARILSLTKPAEEPQSVIVAEAEEKPSDEKKEETSKPRRTFSRIF